jgi:hypothetical protein
MKKVFGVLTAFVLIIGFTAISEANDKAPIALTDAQMNQVVAGIQPGKAHQSLASVLKGGVAQIMPEHVVGEQPGKAHQSLASSLKGGVADLVPDHVRKN